jgi:uncharacterized protein DUF433
MDKRLITADPGIMMGKPVVGGTRITVDSGRKRFALVGQVGNCRLLIDLIWQLKERSDRKNYWKRRSLDRRLPIGGGLPTCSTKNRLRDSTLLFLEPAGFFS